MSRPSSPRRWKVMPPVAVHRQAVPACARPDYWCGIWKPNDHHRQKENKAQHLGHGWVFSYKLITASHSFFGTNTLCENRKWSLCYMVPVI